MATNFKSIRFKFLLRLLNIATLNTQGKLDEPFQREILTKDCIRYKIHIGCFQEVRCEESYTQAKEGTIITMPYDKDTESHFKYGLGFYICPGL